MGGTKQIRIKDMGSENINPAYHRQRQRQKFKKQEVYHWDDRTISKSILSWILKPPIFKLAEILKQK
jgi:hypothetical protein